MGFISVALDWENSEFSRDINEAVFAGAGEDMTVKEMFSRITRLKKAYEAGLDKDILLNIKKEVGNG